MKVLRHAINQGVGGAVLTGIEAAISDDQDIFVKIDGDGQMPPELIPQFVDPIIKGQADFTKGNRFWRIEDVVAMPRKRLVGNAVLSFFAKFSTGYWNLFDPTNGYVAADLRLMKQMPLRKLHRRYFFETDLLFRASLFQAKVVDIPMVAIYADEVSNLKIHKEISRFAWGHTKNFFKRVGYNYFLRDFNVASMELVLGIILCFFGTVFGLWKWGSETPATAGTVMVAALPLFTGILLLLNFLNFDMQRVPREAVSPKLPGSENDPAANENDAEPIDWRNTLPEKKDTK